MSPFKSLDIFHDIFNFACYVVKRCLRVIRALQICYKVVMGVLQNVHNGVTGGSQFFLNIDPYSSMHVNCVS